MALVMVFSLATVFGGTALAASATVTTETELQSALANAAAGDTITISGTITVNAPVVVDKAVTLTGANDASGINFTGDNANILISASDVTVSGLTIGGTASADGNVTEAYIQIVGSSSAPVTGVSIEGNTFNVDNGYDAVVTHYGDAGSIDNLTITGNKFIGGADAVRPFATNPGAANVEISDNEISGTFASTALLSPAGGETVTVSGNKFDAVTANSLTLFTSSADDSFGTVTITGNEFSKATAQSIWLYDDNVLDVAVSGNTFTDLAADSAAAPAVTYPDSSSFDPTELYTANTPYINQIDNGDGTYSLVPVEITITFVTARGTAPADITGVAAGTTVAAPTEPAAANYAFGGWYTDAACTKAFDFSQPVPLPNPLPADGTQPVITLYAKWTLNPAPGVGTAVVTFDSNGGSAVPSQTIAQGSAPILPSNPTKDGYTFAGWYTDAACTAPYDGSVLNADTTLYAGWQQAVVNPGVPDMLTTDHIWYVRGYPDGTFLPTATITRAEVSMAIYRLLQDDLKTGTAPAKFSDVSANDWYGAAIDTLAQLNILKGYPDGTFQPNQPITRAELAALVSSFEDLPGSTANPYTDVSSSHWAYDAILSATAAGWLLGDGNGQFRPDDNLNRAEFVTAVNRVLNRSVLPSELAQQTGLVQYTDVGTGFWGYAAIEEASNSHDYTRNADNSETWTAVTGNGADASYNQ